MKKKIIAGNWKMNKDFFAARDFFNQINEKIAQKSLTKSTCILCVPTPYLLRASKSRIKPDLLFGAQDVSAHTQGAFTGEIAADMLASCEVDCCIVGHSERRKYHNESNQILNEKLFRLQENNITPIYCIGESLQERENGDTQKVLQTQLEEGLRGIDLAKEFIIAYEPIWAIGTGKAATAETAQEAHGFIRQWLSQKYSPTIAAKTPLLYGGSMKPANIKELICQKDIDGGLIGGAALELDSYWEMVKIAEEL